MVEIWAHRGDRARAPENTLAAFAAAIEAGADGVEFDVQLSADGVPVVIHDETLERTTNGTGRVKEHTVAQLLTLDASAGCKGFAGEPIPTLSAVLELLAGSGLRANIELKNSVVDYPGMEEIVLAAVDAAGMNDRVVYSSFSQQSVARLAARGDCEVGLLFEANWLGIRPWHQARKLGATALHAPRVRTSARLVAQAHANEIKVRTWVANRSEEVVKLVRLGVEGIFTDEPKAVRQLVDGL